MWVAKFWVICSAMVTLVVAFSNTGPLYFQTLSSSLADLPQHVEFSALSDKLASSGKEGVATVVFQLEKKFFPKVSGEADFEQFKAKAGAIKKVRYSKKQPSKDIYINGFEPRSVYDELEVSRNALVNDIDALSLKQFIYALNKISKENVNVIVQFIPNHDNDDVSSGVFHEKAAVEARGLSEEQIDADNAKIWEELNESFDKLIEEAEAEGGVVTIQNGANKTVEVENADASSFNNGGFQEIKVTSGSLFDTYQFFSSVILSATIVSLFLVYVLVQGLSWVSSLQVSYRALERPVDGQKKNK